MIVMTMMMVFYCDYDCNDKDDNSRNCEKINKDNYENAAGKDIHCRAEVRHDNDYGDVSSSRLMMHSRL